MATLTVGLEGAENVRIAVDGVVHQFVDGVLEVDDETAESIRRQSKSLFPHLGITVAASASPSEPTPAATPPAQAGQQPAATPPAQAGQQPAATPPAQAGQQPAATPPAQAGQQPEQAPLGRMSLVQLQEAAAGRGIATDGLTKAQIRKLLEA